MDTVLLLATRSTGKLRELLPMCAARGINALGLDAAGVVESRVEDELEMLDSFEGNALAKARHFHAQTGLPTAADDSGLVVPALGGLPGVKSKRWSGRPDLTGRALDDANNRLLLERLRASGGGAGVDDRRAYYVCAAAYVDSAGDVVCRGEVHGRIIEVPRGDEGFGYDPYFAADELGGRTFGEASREEKETVSHRARAFNSLLVAIAERPELAWKSVRHS
jgi:XTP/dITP diphosphohydrolase